MAILGYGEDALTLYALSHGLEDILRQVGDYTTRGETVCLFRPSFGRKGTAEHGSSRSEFGEFDAIIGTVKAIYLTEAKWSSSGEIKRGIVTLRKEQLRRHAVMREYIREWHRERPSDWGDYMNRMKPILSAFVPALKPPSLDTQLGRNLHFVLTALSCCGTMVSDLLLFLSLSEQCIKPSHCEGFTIVSYLCEREEQSSFVRLDGFSG